jgi:UDP-glucose 4-epimerase
LKVLVTGGAGFIGSHSVEAMLDANAQVTVFDNFSNGRRENLPAHAALRVIEGDIRDGEALNGAMQGATHVLHLAAQVSVQASVADPLNSCQNNIAGFVQMLEAARAHGVGRIVYASSAAVYGIPRAVPLAENSPAGPISPYGLEKLINDQYAALYRELHGLNCLGLRYFNVYGPRQDPGSPYAGVISKWAAALEAGEPVRIFGDGEQTRDFIYVKDIARTNLLALRHSDAGICNVGTGYSITLLQLLDTLERAAGKKAQRQFEAAAPGDIRESQMRPQRLHELFGALPGTPLLEGLSALLQQASS